MPDFPNFLTFIGPTWPVENGSVMGPLSTVSEYAVQIIKKMQNENIKSWVPKQDVTDEFNQHAQEWIKHTYVISQLESPSRPTKVTAQS